MGSCAALMKAIDAYLQKADDSLKDVLEEAGFAEPEGTVKAIDALEEKLVVPIQAETDYMRANLGQAVDLTAFADGWPALKAGDAADKELGRIFLDEFEEQMPKLADAYMKRIDPALTVSEIRKRTTDWAESWSAELGKRMRLATHNEMERLLIRHLNEGKGVAELTRAFMDSGIRDEHYRARRAALTETLRAHSVAQQESIMQSPAVSRKEWIHSGAYRNEPRPNHVALSGTALPKEQPFTLYGADGGTYYPMYPRDSLLPPGESVNCHCIHRGIADEKALGLSLEERKRLQQETINADNGEWEKELDARNRAKAGVESGSRRMGMTPGKDNPLARKPVHVADVDFADKRAIMESLETAETQFEKLPHEADCTITSDGKVWLTKGDGATVDPGAIPSSLVGSYAYHNHPKDVTNFSFSADDLAFFLQTESEYLGASDYVYRYSLRRTAETLKPDYEDVVSEFKRVFREEAYPLAFDSKLDIDMDGYHVTIERLSKEYHVLYERSKREE